MKRITNEQRAKADKLLKMEYKINDPKYKEPKLRAVTFGLTILL